MSTVQCARGFNGFQEYFCIQLILSKDQLKPKHSLKVDWDASICQKHIIESFSKEKQLSCEVKVEADKLIASLSVRAAAPYFHIFFSFFLSSGIRWWAAGLPSRPSVRCWFLPYHTIPSHTIPCCWFLPQIKAPEQKVGRSLVSSTPTSGIS